MQDLTLVLGNKNYSSWSLRPWLILKEANIDFKEIVLKLFTDEFQQHIGDYTPARQVPVLRNNNQVIWDSLSIAEYLNESYPGKHLWPRDSEARILARTVSCEMHSGFFALRQYMPMNCRAEDRKVTMNDELQADIERVLQIWSECREKYADKGPWLFGHFSIADAMYAPVAFRFNTYNVVMQKTAADYCSYLLNRPAMQEWLSAAQSEKEVIEGGEAGQ